MAAKGYCQAVEVEEFLTRTFTAAQMAHADNLIERAEARIDRYCNRAWLVGAQTNEAHFYPAYELWLKYAPVASVTSIGGRSGVGESDETLTVDEDYEVRDLNSGLIWLVSPGSYDRVRVTYTPTSTVPADITQACIELVAAWLMPNLSPGSYGLDSYSLPDLSVRFARSHVQEQMPPNVAAILDSYRWLEVG